MKMMLAIKLYIYRRYKGIINFLNGLAFLIDNRKSEAFFVLINDYNKILKHSFVGNTTKIKNEKFIPTFLNIWYHSIEKGLSLGQNTRLGFGKDKIIYLLDLLEKLEKSNLINNGKDLKENHIVSSAISAIVNYKKLHVERGFKLDNDLLLRIDQVLSLYTEVQIRSSVKKYELTQQLLSNDLSYVIANRRSVRNFITDCNPDVWKIRAAVELALNCPTACNRQPFKVRIIQDIGLISKLTLVQGGTAGFNCVPTLLTITFYRRFYHNLIERHSGFIDSGIFLMNLVYSLISFEIDSCILNNAFNHKKEKEIRNILSDVEDEEEFVAFIAVGFGLTNSLVPASFKSHIPIVIYENEKNRNTNLP